MMAPEYEKLLAVFPSYIFGAFNCTGSAAHELLASQMRIKSLPTFRVYLGGKQLDEISGGRPVQLRQMLLHFFRPSFMSMASITGE
jgi:hypothetical protein